MNIRQERNRVMDLLRQYCQEVREIRMHPTHHPETSLYMPFQRLLENLLPEFQIIYEATAEGGLKPDFYISRNGEPVGFVEAKAYSKRLDRLTGRDKDQFNSYLLLPNWALTNYHEIRLYQGKQEVEGSPALLVPASALDPEQSLELGDHDPGPALLLLERLVSQPAPPISNMDDLCKSLAHGARLVREAVNNALGQENPPRALQQVYEEFKDVLFYEIEERDFADAYAQTVTYGLLIARQETMDTITLSALPRLLNRDRHQLLAATLRLLTEPQVAESIGWSLRALIARINRIPERLLEPGEGRDFILYFYEDFLVEYDPQQRRKLGVYFTPPPVVNFQTRMIQYLLEKRFGKRYGFADEGVEVLDPALGTGTYLVSALKEGVAAIKESIGETAVTEAVDCMCEHLYGFELQVGPYTVARYRMESAVRDLKSGPPTTLKVFLTNTLLPSHTQTNIQTHFGFISDPLTEERKAADYVKSHVPIMVILGNPPYGRGKAEEGWVWDTLMEDFRKDVPSHERVNLKNLADSYVFFYRWSLWKLFEQENAPQRGILSFISNRRFLLGGAFGGMRLMLRELFDQIYIVDLHGETSAPLPPNVSEDENIFENIQRGVAITFCIADGSREGDEAEVYYLDIWGTRREKEQWLNNALPPLQVLGFTAVEGTGIDPFIPGLGKRFKSWPSLTEIFLRRFSGVQTKRDHLVVGVTRDNLEKKIKDFLNASPDKQPEIFHETRDKSCGPAAATEFDADKIIRYGYRPLDRRYLYNDRRFVEYTRKRAPGTRRGPGLQDVWGTENLALSTLMENQGHGAGPAAFLHSDLPDMVAYRGSYGTHIFPLYDRSAEVGTLIEGECYNISSEILEHLKKHYEQHVSPHDVFAFVYAVLASEGYVQYFGQELTQSFPRVPFPSEPELFFRGVQLGARLVQLHSFREKYPADGSIRITGEGGEIESPHYDPDKCRLYLNKNTYVAPVESEVWEYQVSGWQVLRQWVERREGIKLTLEVEKELLDVIWILRQTVEMRPALSEFLADLLDSSLLTAADLGIERDSLGK